MPLGDICSPATPRNAVLLAVLAANLKPQSRLLKFSSFISEMSTCAICSLLSETLAQYDSDYRPGRAHQYQDIDLEIGSVEDVTSRSHDCPSCNAILQSTATLTEDAPGSSLIARLSYNQPRLSISASDRSNADLQSQPSISYFTTSTVDPTQPHARLVDSNHINIPLMKSWIHRCDATHEHLCSRANDRYLLPNATLSFIDVEDQCIVTPPEERGKQDVAYVALSYVWGGKSADSILQARRANIRDLCRPGAFAEARYQLPKTVRDAVALTKELGVRYLWVDSVCIVQDDDYEVNQARLRAMGSVYACAYLTIVALSSEHADAGIPRVSSPSALRTGVISLPSQTLIQASHTASRIDSISTCWNTRGWTFQEKIFSCRVLAIDENTATWSCFGDHWTEDIARPSERPGFALSPHRANHTKIGAVTWPSIAAYGRLAAEYATRDLTRSSDTVNAFAGLMAPMEGWFPGGLLHGIAEYTFDIGLLWDVTPSRLDPSSSASSRAGGANLRRDHDVPSPLDVGADISFPTWSWISWTGRLDFNLWAAAEDYAFPRGPLTLSPMAKWHKRLVSDGRWTPVDNTYHVVRKTLANIIRKRGVLPQGWTKHIDRRTNQVYYLDDWLQHVVPRPRFSYPIPPFVRYRDVDFRTFEPQLRFQGLATWVYIRIEDDVRERTEKELQGGGGPVAIQVDLETPDEFWCGRLTLNLERGATYIPAQKELCEVIAISEAAMNVRSAASSPFTASLFSEVRWRPELGDVDTYQVINVLWIGRRGDNNEVFRRALGRIWKPAWEELVTQDVEFILT